MNNTKVNCEKIVLLFITEIYLINKDLKTKKMIYTTVITFTIFVQQLQKLNIIYHITIWFIVL